MPRSIPPLGSIPAEVRSGKQGRSGRYRIQGKFVTQNRLGRGTLNKLLAWGKHEEQRCMNVLRTLPSELPEYNEALEKLDKLEQALDQVKRQLAVGR